MTNTAQTTDEITIPELVRKIINYLTNNPGDQFAEVDAIARELGVSRQYLLDAVRSVEYLSVEPYNNFEQLHVVYWGEEQK